MIIYLYIKQHSITGLKYFGKTTQPDPFKYVGSGTYWTRHVNSHGKEFIKTVEIWGFDNQELCTDFALKFSEENNIVESKEWANLMPENGLSGGIIFNNHIKQFNTLPRSSKWRETQSKNKKGKSVNPNAYSVEARNKRSVALKNYPIVTCPYCGSTGKYIGRFKGSHFEKCKNKKS